MQHLSRLCVVALLSATVEKALSMWHREFPEMRAEVVVIAFLKVPRHNQRFSNMPSVK